MATDRLAHLAVLVTTHGKDGLEYAPGSPELNIFYDKQSHYQWEVEALLNDPRLNCSAREDSLDDAVEAVIARIEGAV